MSDMSAGERASEREREEGGKRLARERKREGEEEGEGERGREKEGKEEGGEGKDSIVVIIVIIGHVSGAISHTTCLLFLIELARSVATRDTHIYTTS